MAKGSDIIKIGFDYRASLEQFEKETNGVFDGISAKAGKQRISIQLDAKNDKVIEKIKELQKLKLDKFTFEFGESGLAEQLKTFDQLEKKINEIINLSKGITSAISKTDFGTKNKTEAYNQLKQMADIFKNFYGNEEAMHSKAGTDAAHAYYKAYEEALQKGVAQSKLEKVTVDVEAGGFYDANRLSSDRIKEFDNFKKYDGDITNLSLEISDLEQRLLKFRDAYSQVESNLGEAPITPEIIKNIENYVRALEVAENRSKDADLFGFTKEDLESDKDYANMYLGFALEDATRENEKYVSSLQEVREEKEKTDEVLNHSSTSAINDSQFDELKADVVEIREELNGVKEKISVIDSDGFENIKSDVEKTTESVKELNSELTELKSKVGDKSNISSGNPTMKDVFQNDSDSSSIAKEESSVMKQVETATEKVTESIKRENVELENQLKILSQVGEFYTDKTVKQTIKQNDGQIIARTYRQKMEKDDEGKSYPVFDKNDNIVYDEAQDVVISNFEKLEKTIVDADNALRKMEDTKQEVLKLDQTASTSFIDEQIEDQKQYITLLEETIKKISEVKIEITDEFGNTSLENVYDIDPKAIQSAREKAAREYTLSTGVKQEKSDAKQSASDEQKRLKNIEQINRALNKQQILIDSIEKSYDKTKNIDLDKSVTDKNDLAELAQKKSEIETLINKLSGQDRNSSNEAEFLQLEKLIAEYKELAKYKLKANNPSEQKLGGTNLEVAIEQQIAQYDKLIIKAEKYGDKTSEIVENLKKQRDILTAVDGNGTHTATSDDYTNARDEYKIANAQVSSIEAQTKVAEQEAKEIQKAWDNAEEAITEYLKAKTKLNTLEATDIKSGNVKDQIDAQKQKVEELEIEAENARKVLSNLLGSQDIDTTTWNNFLKLMKDFEEAGKGSSQSIAKIKDAIANVNTSELQTIDKYIESAQKKLDSTKSGRDDSEKSSSFKIYEKEVQECIDALIAERNRLENAVKSGDIEIIDEGSLSNLNNLKQKLEDTNSEFKTMFKGSAEVSRWKEIDTITKYMEKNTRISKEAKDKLREYIETLKTNGADANVEEIHKAFLRVCDGERKAKREGQSFLDVLRDKVWYQWAAQIGSYFSLNDILRYAKEGIQTVRELDTALTEMRKVSDESASSLKRVQDASFDLANEVGTTALQIQNSIADFMRIGDPVEEAQKHALDANTLLQVSEFDNIEDATSALVSMSKAWDDIDTKHINDVLNILGNNMPIATDELASSLQRSAGTLATLGATIEEAAALTVAGNSILQDPDSVAAGLRTIDLRMVGTTTAKEELQSLGEDVDDFVVQTESKLRESIMNLTKVASNGYKGFDILDENGNYKSFYERMLGLSEIYKELQEQDKKLGNNSATALIELIAGKNRSAIAGAILSSPDVLKESYELAINADGSSAEELEKALDTIDAKMQKLSNQAQEFWHKLIDSEAIKDGVDLLTDLLGVATDFVDTFGMLGTIGIGGGLFAGIKNAG